MSKTLHAPPPAAPQPRSPSRRSRTVRWAAVLALAAVAVLVATLVGYPAGSPPAPERPTAPAPAPAAARYGSGLAWSSGAATEDAEGFARWRGRALDNATTWPNRETWAAIADPDRFGAVSRHADATLLTIGVALLPEREPASFADCAAGRHDGSFRQLGTRLTQLGRGDAVVRLGWEANGDWYAWSIRDQVAEYRDCFRSAVFAIRSTAPAVVIDWNMAKDSHMSGSVASAYPGDDVVDIVGVDFYDMYPAYPTRAAWDRDYLAESQGGPRGLGTWLAFARAHGKKLSVPEWGLNNGTGGGTDNPLFMQLMYEFFAANAPDIAYETYFNLQDPGFVIRPEGINPAGSAAYRTLW